MAHHREKPVEEYQIKALDQALEIFGAFRSEKEEISLAEASRLLQKGEKAVEEVLNGLVSRGYLEPGSQPSLYRLGLKWFLLRNSYLEQNNLRKVAREEMTALMKRVHDSIYLARLDYSSGRVIYIETVDAPESVVLISRVGNYAPVHCTSSGKVHLAFLSEPKRERILSMTKFEVFTSKTITDRATLEDHLEEVRRRGYAVDNEEYYEGIRCVAAPVFDSMGTVLAAVGIAGYISEINDERVDELGREVSKAADRISERLGYRWEKKI